MNEVDKELKVDDASRFKVEAGNLAVRLAGVADELGVDPTSVKALGKQMWVLGSAVLDLAAEITTAAEEAKPRRAPRREPLTSEVNFYDGLPDVDTIPVLEPDPELPIFELIVASPKRLETEDSFIELGVDEVYCLGVLMTHGGSKPSATQVKGLGFRQRPGKTTTNQAFSIAMNRLNKAFAALTGDETTKLVFTGGHAGGTWYTINPNVRFVKPIEVYDDAPDALLTDVPGIGDLIKQAAEPMTIEEITYWLRLQPELKGLNITSTEVQDIILADVGIKPQGGKYSYYARRRILQAFL